MKITKRPSGGKPEKDAKELKPVDKIRILFDEHLPNVKRNEITGEWEVDGRPLTEEDMNSHLLVFQSKFTGISETLFWRYLKSNNITPYNPIHIFFKTRIEQKSKGKIKALAESINTDTGFNDSEFNPNFVEHFLTKWLVGAVAQAHGKGVNPLMPVLAGTKQNTGKTTFFRNLLPKELMAYFAEPKGLSDMKDADLGMLLCENLICFDDEMSGRSWKDWQKMKSMLSMSNYTMRRPYDKRQRKYPRIASLCATNNNLDMLGDPTGNRRLIPINVLSIDHAAYNAVDKEALWMEAYQLFKSGYDHNLNQADIKMLNDCTKDFEVVDETVELLQEYFEPPGDTSVGRMTATQVTQVLMRNSSFKFIHPNKIGGCLKRMGYQQRRDNANGSRTWVISILPQYRSP
ncbi:MAG: hypothetical protein JXR10_04575 [Cyclobacteriaceae bacterium]